MPIYNIAGLKVEMTPRESRLTKQAMPYIYGEGLPEGEKADIIIPHISGREAEFKKENPHLTADECEYILFGADFDNGLIDFDGLLLHSSAVICDGKAYAFSAPSGTGKSTHAAMWLRHFGKRASIVNDDKPAIRMSEDGTFRIYGTPFSGKTDINVNTSAPLQAICILGRAEENSISRISTKEALVPLLSQTLRPVQRRKMDMLLDTVGRLVRTVPVYKMFCNISEEAVETAYGAMSGDEKTEGI